MRSRKLLRNTKLGLRRHPRNVLLVEGKTAGVD